MRPRDATPSGRRDARRGPAEPAPGPAGPASPRDGAAVATAEAPPPAAGSATAAGPCEGARTQTLRGIAVSPGIAIGQALILDRRGLRPPRRAVTPEGLAAELDRLDRALSAARSDAEQAEAEARLRLGPQYADILAAHARMIDDPELRREATARVGRDLVSAEHAVGEVLDGYAARLDGLADRHLAARAADVRDIQRRILDHLTGQPSGRVADGLPAPGVVLTHDLSPSETAGLDPARVLGFATEAGGRTSHTAIVAAALEIPAVVGLGRSLDLARGCTTVIIDGDDGLVILDPDPATLDRYRHAAAERAARFASLDSLAALPAEARDGARVGLLGNIEFPAEVGPCLARGAEGIGLFRTDFLYLNVDRPPSESEQYAAYEAVVRSMRGLPVTIRTLDLGADKVASFRTAGGTAGASPLGLRSLRLSLRDPELFRPQLRAILRAAALGDVRIMFPMVTTLAEFRLARAAVADVAAELAAEGVEARADLPTGIMVEVPAAAVLANQFAKEVDFFSIGTNDLLQYALAVDRTDETVADLYTVADPAVLHLISMVVEAARPRGLDVCVCGAMAGDPLYAALLLGLGVGQLSMPPHQIPEIKRVIRGIRGDEARSLAAAALDCDASGPVVDLLQAALRLALRDEAPTPAARGHDTPGPGGPSPPARRSGRPT